MDVHDTKFLQNHKARCKVEREQFIEQMRIQAGQLTRAEEAARIAAREAEAEEGRLFAEQLAAGGNE